VFSTDGITPIGGLGSGVQSPPGSVGSGRSIGLVGSGGMTGSVGSGTGSFGFSHSVRISEHQGSVDTGVVDGAGVGVVEAKHAEREVVTE
jgi:hypothetical protein